tara:strand:- start:536 stop:805 length:270 start_codon:yes stop_codon:yes gene_type:complete
MNDDDLYNKMGKIFVEGVLNERKDFITKIISNSDNTPTPEILVGIANALHEVKEFVEELDPNIASDIEDMSTQTVYSSCDCENCRRKDR